MKLGMRLDPQWDEGKMINKLTMEKTEVSVIVVMHRKAVN